MKKDWVKYLFCLWAAVWMTLALPGRAYGSQAGYLPGMGGESFDQEAFERELREMLEDSSQLEGDYQYDGSGISSQLPQMEKVTNPPLKAAWNESEAMMRYTLPNRSIFSSSVPDGMVTTLPVTFLPMENARATVRRSGIKVSRPEDGVYREPGDYHINLLVLPNGNESGDNNLYVVDFYFCIIPERTAKVSLLKAPEGFYIDRLERGGTALKPENPKWHFLSQDGNYNVHFADERTGTVAFYTSFVRDTKAPLLSFDPAPDRPEMKQTLHLEVDDPMAAIEMYYNGKPVRVALKTLEIAGYYQYRLTDSAGNERYYSVKMADRFRMPGLGTIMITFVGLAGATAFLVYQRRHPRFL